MTLEYQKNPSTKVSSLASFYLPKLCIQEIPMVGLITKPASCYCWWTKSCTTKDDDYPIIYRVLTIPGGAGLRPSTVPHKNCVVSSTFLFTFACHHGSLLSWLNLFIVTWWPQKTAGWKINGGFTYKSLQIHHFRKENDLNQTSIFNYVPYGSMLIFRDENVRSSQFFRWKIQTLIEKIPSRFEGKIFQPAMFFPQKKASQLLLWLMKIKIYLDVPGS